MVGRVYYDRSIGIARPDIGERQEYSRPGVTVLRLQDHSIKRPTGELRLRIIKMSPPDARLPGGHGMTGDRHAASVCWSIDRVPTKVQYCFGLCLFNQRYMNGLIRCLRLRPE